jgi:hypothetical protein
MVTGLLIWQISQSWRFIGQDSMKKIFKISFIFTIALIANTSFAAQISLEKVLPKSQSTQVGDEILLELSFSGASVSYNALEGSINVPSNFTIQKVTTGASFVSLWLENPTNFSQNKITFSGIIPSGYNAPEGQIFSIVLRATDVGSGVVQVSDINLFRNNGTGTSDHIAGREFPFTVLASSKDYVPYVISVTDSVPPENFSVSLVQDTNLFDGKYALIFKASDKGSGIASYDVSEGREVFKHVESPYLLKNQRLHGKIYVTAYDFEGNSEVETVRVPHRVCIGVSCFGTVPSVIGILVVITLLIWFLRTKLKK